MDYIYIIIIGYLFGCMQFSFFYSRLIKKVDIRTIGVGTAGASNIAISMGVKAGILVGVLDILKGFISILVIKSLFPGLILNVGYLPLYLNGAFVVIGHNYPFFMNFKGGKGTASTVGFMLGLDIRLGLLTILTVFVVTVLTDYIAIGTMSMLVILCLYTMFFHPSFGTILIVLFLVIQSVYKHRINFTRIHNKEENGLKQTLNKKKD
ncbi:MAG: glycerol-3-phosphate acyltransferase [Gudongella sp.]|nr:glycerol-3-phosphate acyltransferase [Gudongella sp.]